MLSLSFALVAMLSFAPPDSGGNTMQALQQAIDRVGTEQPETSIVELEAALAEAAKHPEIASSEDAQAKLANARLVLAWLHLAEGDDAAAAAAMDEALRSARGSELDAGKFGPAILELHDARKAVLGSSETGTIEIDCRVPCAVVVNERKADNPVTELPLGSYRVWISATEGDPDWTFHEVELTLDASTQSLSFEGPTPIVEERPVKSRKRMLPRWAEIVGLTAGLGLIAGGAVLMSLNGKCQGGGDPATCPAVYDNTIQGASLLGVGGAVFLTFGAVLTVDEVRIGKAKGRQAMLTWTMRF